MVCKMKALKDMSEKELKDLLKKLKAQEKLIDKTIKNDKEIKKLREKYVKLDKELDRIRKEIDKRDKLKFITTDGTYPSFYYSGYGKQHNIRDEIFEAIKKSGFRISKLKDTQIVDFSRFVLDKLEDEDKELKKLKRKEEELCGIRDEIFDKEMKIIRRIKEKLRKIPPYLSFEIKDELRKKEELKKSPEKAKKRKEVELERERFNNNYDKVYEKFKEIIEVK